MIVRGGKKRPSRGTATAQKVTMLRRQVPKSSVVLIDRPTEDTSIASVMQKVAAQINLEELELKVNNTKKSKAGQNQIIKYY